MIRISRPEISISSVLMDVCEDVEIILRDKEKVKIDCGTDGVVVRKLNAKSVVTIIEGKDGEGADRATGSETCGSDVQRTIQTDTESEPSELGEQGEISPDLSEGDSGVLF